MKRPVRSDEELPLALVCRRLRLSWPQAYRLLLTGRLEGVQHKGRWFCRRGEVERVARELDSTVERPQEA